MNAEALLKHYERIADAPDAVERLRRFVLDLAVRGKLVPQRHDDELNHAIGTTSSPNPPRRQKRKTEIATKKSVDVPYALPLSWVWMALGDVAEYGQPDKVNSNDELTPDSWVLDLEDIEKETSRLIQRVTSSERPFQSSKTIFRKGDVLFGKLRPYLNKVLVADTDGVCTTEIVPVRGIGMTYADYLALVLRSPLTMERIERLMYGMKMPRLGTADASELPVPVPLLAEQHRIVAKVDELMALCDQLEAARAEREATRDRLATASLARLNTPDPDPETFKAHARFAISTALPALTTRPDQIKQLRQTILNLAMRGKLVAQDSSDAPASQFLSELAETISTYCTINRVRRTIPSDISEIPFAPPSGWQWTRLSELFSVITDGDHQPPPKSGEGVAFLTIGNVTSGRLDFSDCRLVSEDYFNAIPKYRVPERGDILYTVVGATFGRPCPVDTNRPFCVQRHIAILKPAAGTNQQFLLRLLSSPLIYSQAAAGTTGTAQPTIALAPLRSFLVPIPPIEEQHRIVEKVNKLMQLCDQLEASLESGADIRRCLLDALLHGALLPMNGKVIDFAAARQRLQEQRESIACRVVQRLGPTRGFGRVRAMKPLYWAEAHCGAALGGQWGRAEAGPFDQWIFNFEAHAASAGWFSVTEHRNGDKVTKAEYRAGTGLSAKAAGAAEALGSAAPEFERVLSLLADLNTEDSEIVTTLYAAWNDLLLEGKPFSDAAVITDVREHWHPSKARFTPAVLQTWLDWLRKNRLVPRGQGPNTRHQPELI